MGKDRRIQSRQCLRCEKRAEEDSELCVNCEVEALEEIPHGLGGGWGAVLVDDTGNYARIISGTFGEYDDPLDQARADSMVGE